jgi:hypothetical protein
MLENNKEWRIENRDITREKVKGATVHKAGSKIPT